MSELRILMADDQEKEIAEAHRTVIEMGHKVKIATSFDEAKKLAQSEAYDIAVVDLG